jgi:phosphohistidine phosphatase SixA
MPEEKKSPEHPNLTITGADSASSVGQRFSQFLADTRCPGNVVVYDVDTPQSEETADIVRHELGTLAIGNTASVECLSPKNLPTYGIRSETVETAWAKAKQKLDQVERYVVVGHDPQMSWLLHHLAGQEVKWHSLTTGELMLLERRSDDASEPPPYRRPRYVFSPSDPGASVELRGKIKSKMDTAKVLGTFLTALVTFAATQVLDRDNVSSASAVLAVTGLALLAIATVLYFVTLFLYDGLLMPTRFWPTRLPEVKKCKRFWPARLLEARNAKSDRVLRPPGSDVWVLYESMLRVWNRAFVPATFFAGAGVALLTLALADPAHWWWLIGAGVIVIVIGTGAYFYRLAKPHLGVND